MMMLPVLLSVVQGFRMRDCKLCGESCDSENQLPSSAPDDRWGGHRPWQAYPAVWPMAISTFLG